MKWKRTRWRLGKHESKNAAIKMKKNIAKQMKKKCSVNHKNYYITCVILCNLVYLKMLFKLFNKSMLEIIFGLGSIPLIKYLFQ